MWIKGVVDTLYKWIFPKCFVEFSDKSISYYSKRALTCHPATPCVRDPDATTVPARLPWIPWVMHYVSVDCHWADGSFVNRKIHVSLILLYVGFWESDLYVLSIASSRFQSWDPFWPVHTWQNYFHPMHKLMPLLSKCKQTFQWNIQIALTEFYSRHHQILLRYSRLALQKHGKAIYWTNRFMSDHIINSLSNMVELWLVLTFYYICVKMYVDGDDCRESFFHLSVCYHLQGLEVICEYTHVYRLQGHSCRATLPTLDICILDLQ